MFGCESCTAILASSMKPSTNCWSFSQVREQELERHALAAAVADLLLGLEDLGHAAQPEPSEQPVPPELGGEARSSRRSGQPQRLGIALAPDRQRQRDGGGGQGHAERGPGPPAPIPASSRPCRPGGKSPRTAARPSAGARRPWSLGAEVGLLDLTARTSPSATSKSWSCTSRVWPSPATAPATTWSAPSEAARVGRAGGAPLLARAGAACGPPPDREPARRGCGPSAARRAPRPGRGASGCPGAAPPPTTSRGRTATAAGLLPAQPGASAPAPLSSASAIRASAQGSCVVRATTRGSYTIPAEAGHLLPGWSRCANVCQEVSGRREEGSYW